MKIKKILAIVLTLLIVALSGTLTGCNKTYTIDEIENSTEASVAKKRANLSNPAEGYYEKETDALREKILNSPNTEELYEITGTKYYISSSGDDNNDGLSPETPIKTISGIKELYLMDGDALLFKRGDTFRFGESLIARRHITYGSYGEGPKPKIYGSPENYAKSDKWEKEKENIWKIHFDYPEACGLVINHSELVGIKKVDSIDNLSANGDYLHDTEKGIFYLYCDKGNPFEAYVDIEIMPSITLVSLSNSNRNVIIDNLCLKYAAGFGINTIHAKNFTVTNCEFGFLGGKWVDSTTKTLRYGNAIEIWSRGEDIKVENNWFYQTYDSALTWQGRNGDNYINISFSGNLFEYNNADIEFFDRGSTVKNFHIENNIMRFTSMGWGTRKTDGGIRGIEGCLRAVSTTPGKNGPMKIESIYFTNNTLDCPARQTINWNWVPSQKEFIHFSGTKLYIKSEYRTLEPCLQGLQTEEATSYDRRFAVNLDELKEGFKLFEQGAKIYWDGE